MKLVEDRGVLVRRGDTQRKTSEHRGRDPGDAALGQGTPGATRSHQEREEERKRQAKETEKEQTMKQIKRLCLSRKPSEQNTPNRCDPLYKCCSQISKMSMEN